MNAPLGFRNAAALDFHLVPGAAGIDRADAVDAPAMDRTAPHARAVPCWTLGAYEDA